MKSLEQRAAAYVSKMAPAIAGSGGHAATFAVACRLVEFGLTVEQAMPVFEEWNQTHCQPPWTENELQHKLADAFKKTSAKNYFTSLQSPSPNQKRCSNPSPVRRFAHAHADNTKKPVTRPIDAIAAKLHEGTEAELDALARLRGLSVAALILASDRGLLRFGEMHGHPGWFILDKSRRVVQARRLDGQKWFNKAKAWTLPGSQAAWPVGIGEAQNFPIVALCEGAPDLLAACHFIASQGRAADCAPVAVLSASYSIAADALPFFTGKRVRIFAHDDEAGNVAASRWMSQLTARDVETDTFSFAGLFTRTGESVKDLNAFTQIRDENLLAKLLP